jgi:phosphoglycerate dehydrogenase-like enzyme
MHVIGASRDPQKFGADPAPYHRVVHLTQQLDLALAQADHIVLTLPLTEKTRGLIGMSQFAQMKPNASLINVARGPILDEVELCKALSCGRIGSAYIDRPIRFPPPLWSRLYRTRNLFLIHNSAANSATLLDEASRQFITGLRDLLNTGHPPNRIA